MFSKARGEKTGGNATLGDSDRRYKAEAGCPAANNPKR